MVAQVQNTLVSLYRAGTTTNGFGDVVDEPGEFPYMQHVPACLTERSQIVQDPATQEPMTVRAIQLLIPPWTNALESDQVMDESSGDIYSVQDIVKPPTTIGAPVDLLLTLRRVAASV